MASDDTQLTIVKRDLSGGVNTRQGKQIIGDNQAVVLENAEINTAGERSIRKGATLIEDLSTSAGTSMYGFEPTNGAYEIDLIMGKKLFYSSTIASGGFSTAKNDFTTNLSATMVRALESDEADVLIVSNGIDNVFRMTQAHAMQDLGNDNGSPPLTTVYEWYRNRLWALKDNKLFYSGAIPSDYSTSATGGFVRDTNYYTVPVGSERALKGTRDYGLLVFGNSAIYALDPSILPAPATDKPDKMLDYGCAAGKTVKQVGDDFLFMSNDGVRGLKRTLQDKLQSGDSKPLSWNLKDEYEEINWAYITKADATVFDNKYIITLPTGTSTYNNKIWVYYPAFNAWTVITGLNIASFGLIHISGEERLYGVDGSDGLVYRLFYGTSDNGTAIIYNEQSRAEDFGKPLQYKWGGEFKIKIRGAGATVDAYANLDGAGFLALDGANITLPTGTGLSFPFDFPIDFPGETEVTNVWHFDSLGKFKNIQFKIYCDDKDATLKILESMAITFLEEYQSEDD